MSRTSNRTTPVLLILVTISIAAAIPVVGYLIYRGMEDGKHTDAPLGQGTAQSDLERLARARSLGRESLFVRLGEDELLSLKELVKEPGSENAVAAELNVALAPFFSVRRSALDEGVSRFFEGLPPGTTRIESDQFNVSLAGADSEEPAWLIEGYGAIAMTEQGFSVELKWTPPGNVGEASLNLLYHTRTGILDFDYRGDSKRSFPAAFFPRDVRIRVKSMTLEQSRVLTVRGLELWEKDENKLASVESMVFDGSRALDLRVFGQGLSRRWLQRLPGWTLEAEEIDGTWRGFSAIPSLSWLAPGTDQPLKADKLSASEDGAVRLEGVKATFAKIGVLSALSLSSREVGRGRVFNMEAPVLEMKSQGVVWQSPEAQVEVDEYQAYSVRSDSFELVVQPNPLLWATWLKRGLELRGELEKVWRGEAPLPKLVLPEGIPDVDFKAEGGVVKVPLLSQRTLKGVGLTLQVRGGTLEEASVQACLGKENCEELDGSFGVTTDSLGTLEEISVHVSGTRLVNALVDWSPEHFKGALGLSVGVTLVPSAFGDELEGTFDVSSVGLSVFHKRLALTDLVFPQFEAKGKVLLDRTKHNLELRFSRLRMGQVFFRGALGLYRYTGVPKINATVDFPQQDCGALFRSLPQGMAPRLSGATLSGSINFRVQFEVDLKQIRETIELDVDGSLDHCSALTLGPGMDVLQLNSQEYVHRVVVAGEDLGIDVGPGTRGYVPLDQIPRIVQAAAYGTEDLAFYRHNGFRLGLIKRALILFLERGYYAYGGSTISQQLVKNLFLSREKTLSRKLEEAIIVWTMEHHVSKERILELYLNCIEYGPKIWGIANAAHVYFGKHPSELNVMEAAFIMGLKPDPQYGFLQYKRGKLNKHWRKNLDRVFKRLWDMQEIDKETYEASVNSRLRFKSAGRDKEEATPDEDRPVRATQEEL